MKSKSAKDVTNKGLVDAIGQALDPSKPLTSVVFGVPSLTEQFDLRFVGSLVETVTLMACRNITTIFEVQPGDQFVAKARNKIVTRFLEQYPDAENFFFLDDDVGWQHYSHKVLEFLLRPEDIICGIYPKKSVETDFPTSLAYDEATGELIRNNGLIEAVMAPTGFMRIKRHVLEALAKTASKFKDAEPDGKLRWYHYIFESGRGPGEDWWGEDYTFCVKARQAGFRIWIDPDIEFTHQGKFTFKEKIGNHIEHFAAKAKAQAEKDRAAKAEEAVAEAAQ